MYWLAPRLPFSYNYTTQTHKPRDGATQLSGPSFAISNQKKKKVRKDMPKGQPGGDYSVKVPWS